MRKDKAKENGHDGPKRAGLYARVSTDAQVDNTSLDSQLTRCREYCQRRGYVITVEMSEAISGTFILARTKYNELLNMLAAGTINLIVCDIPDRLGRGDAIAVCEYLAKMNGGIVEYASPGRDASTIEGFIQKSAEQMVSGIERLNIRRRMMQGRRDRARSGQVIGSAHSAYGYRFQRQFNELGRKTSTRLVICEPEAEIVRHIFNLCAVEQLSSNAIATRLNHEKVPTPHGRSELWWSSSIACILRNETYAGRWHYAKIDSKTLDQVNGRKREQHRRDKAEWIAVAVEPIISEYVFQEAQKQINGHRHMGFRPPTHEYLLHLHIRCARCNAALCSHAQNNGHKVYLYYRCRKAQADHGSERCEAKALRVDRADVLVWQGLKKRLKNKRLVRQKFETDRIQAEKTTQIIRANIAALIEKNEQAQAKIKRWKESYGEGEITKEEFYADKHAVEAEIRTRTGEIEELQAKLAESLPISPEEQKELEEYCDTVALGVDHATFEEKRKYLDWLRVQCLFDDRTGDIHVTGVLGAWRHSSKTSRYPVQVRSQVRFDFIVNLSDQLAA